MASIPELKDNKQWVWIDGFGDDGKAFIENYVPPSVPSVLFFKDGRFVDYELSPSRRSLLHALHRNGFDVDDPGFDNRWQKIPKAQQLRTIAWTPAIQSVDFSGMDLTGGFFQKHQLAGTSFENTNLSGANFNNALLFRTSFKGADLTGATFDGARFHETVCPDGTTTNDGGCFNASPLQSKPN